MSPVGMSGGDTLLAQYRQHSETRGSHTETQVGPAGQPAGEAGLPEASEQPRALPTCAPCCGFHTWPAVSIFWALWLPVEHELARTCWLRATVSQDLLWAPGGRTGHRRGFRPSGGQMGRNHRVLSAAVSTEQARGWVASWALVGQHP